MRPLSFNPLRGEKGFISPLLLMLVLLGLIIMGLVIDLGNAYFQHKRLQNIADMSAIAVGDKTQQDSSLANDSQKIENLLQEMIVRNAQITNTPITAGNIQITVYQNNPDKLFDIEITKNISPLLLKLSSFNLNAKATYGGVSTAGGSVNLIAYVYDDSAVYSNTINDVRNAIRVLIDNLRIGDYVAVASCGNGFNADFPARKITSEADKKEITNQLSSFPKYGGSINYPLCLTAGRSYFLNALKSTVTPSGAWQDLRKNLILITSGTNHTLANAPGHPFPKPPQYAIYTLPYHKFYDDLHAVVKPDFFGFGSSSLNGSVCKSASGGSYAQLQFLMNAVIVQQTDYFRQAGISVQIAAYDPNRYRTPWDQINWPQRFKLIQRLVNAANFQYQNDIWLTTKSEQTWWRNYCNLDFFFTSTQFWPPFYTQQQDPVHRETPEMQGEYILIPDQTSQLGRLIKRSNAGQKGLVE